MTGNIAEIKINPRWPHSSNLFGCHVAPVPNYSIYDIEYFVYVKVGLLCKS